MGGKFTPIQFGNRHQLRLLNLGSNCCVFSTDGPDWSNPDSDLRRWFEARLPEELPELSSLAFQQGGTVNIYYKVDVKVIAFKKKLITALGKLAGERRADTSA